jgi:pimeloyl-ACP methyl ester carboxylesterase
VKCPVVAIHGDYDPHPPEGIRLPLSQILQDFRFILLKNCGHKPWIEKMAKERFFEILETETDR